MIRISKLILENFGPFKGVQALALGSEDGVVVVYGENMRGKTTLLNAIRYAFFEKVISRGEREVALHQISNWEAAKEGEYGFSVTLAFSDGTHDYELVRTCRLRDGAIIPKKDYDYITETFLRRDGNYLGPEEERIVLARLMPEQVSRFFLFDGELLQQYEELLRDETDMGRRIKEAIEHILGVPVLTNGRSDIRELYKEAQREESKTAQKDQRTNELGNHQARLIEQRTVTEGNIATLRNDLSQLEEWKRDKEETLKQNEQLRGLLAEKDALEKDIESIDHKIINKTNDVRSYFTDVWQWTLLPMLNKKISVLQEQIDKENTRETKRTVANATLKQAQEALSKNYCTTCNQKLSEASTQYLESEIKRIKGDLHDLTPIENISNAIEQKTSLTKLLTKNKIDVARQALLDIESHKIERATKIDRIEEIQEQTKDMDESKIRKLYSEYEKTVREVGAVKEGIDKETILLNETDSNLQRIQEQLTKIGGTGLDKARRRREIYEKTGKLLNEGVSAYRDRLKERVEADASELFRKLTSEPDYMGLTINKNYGLTIVHKDGEMIPVRSAGAEHIVALSLMGSLQKNAPLRGPIFMDSPFGRLDDAHTTKVVEALPDMAAQVILLVYQSELAPKVAREHLKGNLRAKYRIVRRSARHSDIEKFTGE